MGRDKKRCSFGVRQFVRFDERTDLGLYLSTKAPIEGDFQIMVHRCDDDSDGVILWFDFNGREK